jgi:hypothetical protein
VVTLRFVLIRAGVLITISLFSSTDAPSTQNMKQSFPGTGPSLQSEKEQIDTSTLLVTEDPWLLLSSGDNSSEQQGTPPSALAG